MATGAIRSGFNRPVLAARSGSGEEGLVKVAVSASGAAYLAWLPADETRWRLVVDRNGRVSSSHPIELPQDAALTRLGDGARGTVDALWFESRTTPSEALRFYCSQIEASGRIAATEALRAGESCGLATPRATAGCPPRLAPQTPEGYEVAGSPVVGRDRQGDAVAVWDDWPLVNGAARGLFAETCLAT